MFGRKHKHICIPHIISIQKEVDEVGGKCWILTPEEFDRSFCGVVCFRNPDNKIWSIMQVGNEFVKVYRGKNLCGKN